MGRGRRTWDLGTRGLGDIGTWGRGDSESRLDAWGLADVINKQHLTFALNLKNTIFGGQVLGNSI